MRHPSKPVRVFNAEIFPRTRDICSLKFRWHATTYHLVPFDRELPHSLGTLDLRGQAHADMLLLFLSAISETSIHFFVWAPPSNRSVRAPTDACLSWTDHLMPTASHRRYYTHTMSKGNIIRNQYDCTYLTSKMLPQRGRGLLQRVRNGSNLL